MEGSLMTEQSAHTDPLPATAAIERCWAEIGIHGDRSCVQLVQHLHCRNCKVYWQRGRQIFDRAPLHDLAPPFDTTVNQVDHHETVEENCLLFALGRQLLALPMRSIADVAKAQPSTRIPHRNRGALEGLVNIQGELQLCISLIEVLGLGQRGAIVEQVELAQTRMVMLQGALDQKMVFRATRVLGVERLHYRDRLAQALDAEKTEQDQPISFSQALQSCMRAMLVWQNQDVILLNPVALERALNSALYA
jgi:chemotaxis-related protein WspD